jgi:parallel beta-helix repeat protein
MEARTVGNGAFARVLILAVIAALALGAGPAAAQPACGDVLTQDTTLTADLDCDDTALVIGAPGITLDLAGHRVIANDAVVILNEGHDDVTIRNGAVLSTSDSIRLVGVSGNVLRDLRFDGLIKGVTLEDSRDNRIVSNLFRSLPLVVQGSDRNVIAHNTITSWEGYLGVSDSHHNRIVDNIVWVGRSSAFGLRDGSHHNQVRRNVFLNDSYSVMGVSGASDNDFVENTIGSSTSVLPGTAGDIADSSRNRFVRNTVFGVTQGLRLLSGDANVFRENDVSGVPRTRDYPSWMEPPPVADGIPISAAATGTVVRDNIVRGFDDDGIDVAAAGTRLRGNSATDNGDLGIEAVPGVIDLGGNTASGNGNSLQCTNVLCR